MFIEIRLTAKALLSHSRTFCESIDTNDSDCQTNKFKRTQYIYSFAKILFFYTSIVVSREEIQMCVYAEFLLPSFPCSLFFSASSKTSRRENDAFSVAVKAVREQRGKG